MRRKNAKGVVPLMRPNVEDAKTGYAKFNVPLEMNDLEGVKKKFKRF